MKCALIFVLAFAIGTYGYTTKEHYFTSDLLRDVMSRMSKDFDNSYLDFPEGRLPLGSRSLAKELEEEEQLYPLDYETLEPNLHPSLRDQEFLQHSSLWGNQYVSGGAGEGKQRLKPEGTYKNRQEIKTDATLPAYCNPPNPCPIGYSAENGCLEKFENTATFSRKYQAAQDCMCDSEHMFDCPSGVMQDTNDALDAMDALNELEFNRFLQHSIQVDPSLQHKNLVAKKFNNFKKSERINPFLTGERLPVAAKKGNNVYY